MKNTLKFSLLLIGIALIGYGIYTIIFPHISLENGSEKIKSANDNIQSYAMVAFGVLCLIGGIAFQKR